VYSAKKRLKAQSWWPPAWSDEHEMDCLSSQAQDGLPVFQHLLLTCINFLYASLIFYFHCRTAAPNLLIYKTLLKRNKSLANSPIDSLFAYLSVKRFHLLLSAFN